MEIAVFGRILLVIGALIVLTGLLMLLFGKLGLGHLPGDIVWRGRGTTVYAPIATMILLSVTLTLLLNLVLWLFRGK
jgi:hypothetical protein